MVTELKRISSILRPKLAPMSRTALKLNPELNRLTEVAKNGLLDVVVLTNVQIFTRRPSYLAVILQVFQDAGVQVETIE